MDEKLNFSVGDAIMLKTGSIPCVIQEITEDNTARCVYWSKIDRFFQYVDFNLACCIKIEDQVVRSYREKIISGKNF